MHPHRFALALALALTLAPGCAHTSRQSWNAETRTVCAGKDCYQIGALGPEWKLVSRARGSAGFVHGAGGGVILSHATCRDDAEAAPLASLTAHMLIGYSERRERAVRLVAFAEREALRSVLDGKLDGVPIVLDLYVLKRNGCIFDLSYVAPVATYDAGLADFQRFVDGFQQQPREGT